MQIKVGSFYIDGNGDVHGPLKLHPSQPAEYFVAVGATYYRDGRHVSSWTSEQHKKLDLVAQVFIQIEGELDSNAQTHVEMRRAKCGHCNGSGFEHNEHGDINDCSVCHGNTFVEEPVKEAVIEAVKPAKGPAPWGVPDAVRDYPAPPPPLLDKREPPEFKPAVGATGTSSPSKDPEGDNPFDRSSQEWYEIFKTVLVGAANHGLGLAVGADYIPPYRIIERAEKLADFAMVVHQKHSASIESSLKTLYIRDVLP